MALGEVLREFGVKVSLAFDGKKIDEAEKKIKDFSSEMRSFALEVAGITAGLFATGKSFTAFGRSVANQAGALNISTDELQEYEYAAGVAADANREDLVSSFQSLGDTLDKARAGVPEARQALFNLANASGRGAELVAKLQDPMFKVTDAAKLLSDGIQKMSLTNPLAARRMTELAFGSDKLYNLWRQGPKAIDALNKEADKNSVISKKMIDEGNQLDMQLTRIWFIFRKFGLEIGANVMRHLMPMIGQFMKWFGINKKLIASGINAFLDNLTEGLKAVFDIGVDLVDVLKPIIAAVGGIGNATKILIGAFLAFKAIKIAISFAEMIASIVKLTPVVIQLGVAFAPILAVVAGLTSLVAIIHDLWSVLNGGKLEDTWLGQLGNKITTAIPKLNIGDKLFDFLHPMASAAGGTASSQNIFPSSPQKLPYSAVPSLQISYPNSGASAGTNQENHFNTTNNITLPPGTSATTAAATISKATVDSHEELMIKAKMDSVRNRQY